MPRRSLLDSEAAAYKRFLQDVVHHGRALSELSWSAVAIDSGSEDNRRREERRIRLLRSRGLKGWARRQILFTGELPEGCRRCLAGRGSALAVTHACTRDCWFCPNPKPRRDALSLGGCPVGDERDVPELARRFGLEMISLSGGDPLTRLPRALALIRGLRARLGSKLYLQLYTTGDRLDERALALLKDAGLDEIRINVVANGYDLEPVRRALLCFENVGVEVPALPQEERRLKKTILRLDALGARHLIIHELCFFRSNVEALRERGFQRKSGAPGASFRFTPASRSGLSALRLLAFAQRRAKRLSVFYCSSGSFETITRRCTAYRLRRLNREESAGRGR